MLGSEVLVTRDPENVKAIFASSFEIGASRYVSETAGSARQTPFGLQHPLESISLVSLRDSSLFKREDKV